jgi:anti-anti-sigma regulatory factor/HAMP domain-containing protein
MMQFMKQIRFKVLLVIASVAILSIAVVYYFAESTGKRVILEDSFNMLQAIRETKANQIETYFQNIENQLITFSEDKMVIEAMHQFRQSSERIPQDIAVRPQFMEQIDRSLKTYYQKEFSPRLSKNSSAEVFSSNYIPTDLRAQLMQYEYVSANPNPIGEKNLLEAATTPSQYNRTHALYHPILNSFQEKFGFYDLFLVDIDEGRIVYSVFKEVDFGTSLLSGPYQNSKIAEVYKSARNASYPDFTKLVDFFPYEPSYNAPASFIASPIFDGNQKIGVLIFQMPIDRINGIMTNNFSWTEVGLGESGESYIVGNDLTLRNQSRFLIEAKEDYLEAIQESGVPKKIALQIDNLNSSIGLQPVNTQGTEAAIAGETGEATFKDYRDVEVLSAYAPLDIKNVNWAVLSEIDKSEAMEPLRKMRLRFLLFFVGIFFFILWASYFFSNSLTKRIKLLDVATTKLAEGDLNVQLKIKGEDEISSLAASFEKMRLSIQELIDKQSKTIDALTASLIPLTDDIGVMVLIGSFDEHRVKIVRKNLTEGLNNRYHKVVILDVTSIPSFDQDIGEGIIKIAKAAHLMGSQVILSGIHASMAIELTELDLNLGNIKTQNSLQNGIKEAMHITASIK